MDSSPSQGGGAPDYRAFFESNGAGNVIVDIESGRFVSVNRAFCELTGYSRHELAELTSQHLTHPEDRERDARGWEEALGREASHHTIEKRYLRKDGVTRWVSVTSNVVRDGAGRALYATGVVMDVTAARRAAEQIEQRVAERTQAFETLIDASPVAVIALDCERRVEVWNPAAEHLFSLRESEVLGRRLLDLELAWHSPEALDALLDAPANDHAALSVETARGGRHDVSVWSAPHSSYDGRQNGRVLLVLDETEKKFLEHALLDAGEREQRRIGQELHEGLCQQLVGAAFGSQALAKELESSASPSAGRAAELTRIINDSVLHARNLARGINPVEIDSRGLMSALQELAERSHAGLAQVVLHCDRPVLVRNTETALHVFRIAQEALTNALRHARATRVEIRLVETAESVTLQIRDNGAQIASAPSSDAGVRVGIMKYRAQAIHGELSIDPDPGGGAAVTCTFPNH